MPRKTLTDRTLKARYPLNRKPPYDIMDTVVPGLALRVLASGHRSFVVIGRFPGSHHPTRRALRGVSTLKAARAKARHWIELLAAGKDPSIEADRAKRAALRQYETKFVAVLERYIEEAVIGPNPDEPLQRSWRETSRDMRRELAPWAQRPISDIDRQDVLTLVRTIKQRSVAQARNVWGYIYGIFSWAIQDGSYGLVHSPCDHIRITKILGAKKKRDRAWNDDELTAFERSAARLSYPHGPAYRILLRTGLRLTEVTEAVWSEIDLSKREWLIPAKRMKGREGMAKPHLVPLTEEMVEIFATMPRFAGGDFVFTTTAGRRPVQLPKVKKALDALMLAELQAMATARNKDAAGVLLAPWRNHDIRRSVRSNLSRLKIAEEVREAVLAHVRPGIKSTYDLYDYKDEKASALQAWSNLLHSIVEPAEASVNVVSLRS